MMIGCNAVRIVKLIIEFLQTVVCQISPYFYPLLSCLSLSPNFIATYARPPIYYIFRLFFPWIFSSMMQFEAAALIDGDVR